MPQNKAVFRLDAGRELAFVDFAAGDARSAGRMPRSSDSASLSCPQWEHGGSALGIHEQRGTANAYYLVDWSKAALAEPVLALTSQGRISAHGFMLR